MAKETNQPITASVHQQWNLQLPPLKHSDYGTKNCLLAPSFSEATSKESSLIECNMDVVATIKKLESTRSDQQIIQENPASSEVQAGQGDKTHQLVVRQGSVALSGGYSFYYLSADQLGLFIKIKTYIGYEFTGPFRLVKKTKN